MSDDQRSDDPNTAVWDAFVLGHISLQWERIYCPAIGKALGKHTKRQLEKFRSCLMGEIERRMEAKVAEVADTINKLNERITSVQFHSACEGGGKAGRNDDVRPPTKRGGKRVP